MRFSAITLTCRVTNWWLLQKPIGGSCRNQLVAPAEANWWLLQKTIGGSCRNQLVAPAEDNWWLLQKPIGGSCRRQLVAPAEANWWLLQKISPLSSAQSNGSQVIPGPSNVEAHLTRTIQLLVRKRVLR